MKIRSWYLKTPQTIALTLICGFVLSFAIQPAFAVGTLTLEATFTGSSVANGWVKVERYFDSDPNFPVADYPPDGRGDQGGQRLTFFGNVAEPAMSRFLLYYAPGWNTNTRTVPVLLVHGSNDNADHAWANPNEFGGGICGANTCPGTGMMQFLSGNSFKVFAINFPHKQGDNLLHAQLIYDAIQRVKAVTGAAQVDVVAWSAGAFAARLYVSSVKPAWGKAYGGDVRKVVLVGNPNAGLDYDFRHGWTFNFGIFPECGGVVNGPSPHTEMVCTGLLRNHPELSIYTTSTGNFFPGQKQLLARWDNVFSLPANEQDWQTTYYGGTGFYTIGSGIQNAMNQGSLVATMRSAGIPSSVTTYLLAGGANTIPMIHNEHTGPSDGILFIASATDTGGIGKVGGVTTLNGDNHLQLGWESSAVQQVMNWLLQ